MLLRVPVRYAKTLHQVRGGRGLMSNPEVCNTEVAFTSLVCRALDRFLFPTETTGACLHQAPVCALNENPDKSGIYVVKFAEKFLPGYPVSCTDFVVADEEMVLYNAAAVQEGGCSD